MDWENKTEGVFVQDFPFLPQGRPEDPSDFGQDLRNYLAALDSWANDSPCQRTYVPSSPLSLCICAPLAGSSTIPTTRPQPSTAPPRATPS